MYTCSWLKGQCWKGCVATKDIHTCINVQTMFIILTHYVSRESTAHVYALQLATCNVLYSYLPTAPPGIIGLGGF